MVESNEDEMISAGNVDDEVSANFANRVLRGSARDMWARSEERRVGKEC